MKLTVIGVERGGNPAAPVYKVVAESSHAAQPAVRVEMIDTKVPSLMVGEDVEIALDELTDDAS